jgi:hypothetical protein
VGDEAPDALHHLSGAQRLFGNVTRKNSEVVHIAGFSIAEQIFAGLCQRRDGGERLVDFMRNRRRHFAESNQPRDAGAMFALDVVRYFANQPLRLVNERATEDWRPTREP